MNAANYAKSFILEDGRSIRLRSIRPDDRESLLDGFRQLSKQSVYYRFFSAKQRLDNDELDYLSVLDFDKHVAIGAALMIDGKEVPVAVGRYIVIADSLSAEFSITVQDKYQQQGIGRLLIQQLVLVAKEAGITHLVANVMPSNRKMLYLLAHSGLKVEMTKKENLLYIKIDISGDESEH